MERYIFYDDQVIPAIASPFWGQKGPLNPLIIKTWDYTEECGISQCHNNNPEINATYLTKDP